MTLIPAAAALRAEPLARADTDQRARLAVRSNPQSRADWAVVQALDNANTARIREIPADGQAVAVTKAPVT
jgi:hypothetical protein